MTGTSLSPDWERWRRKRLAEFLASGMNLRSADEASRAEAAARQHVERHTDRRTAMAAELAVMPNDQGEGQIVLLIDPNLIPPTRKGDAKDALHVTGFAIRL